MPKRADVDSGTREKHRMAAYDYLVVGAGLYGGIFAREMGKRG